MKICFLIISLTITIQLVAQPIAPAKALKIYNADELVNIAKTKGIHQLEKIINPIDLIELDSTYAPLIIDLEFKSDFFGKLDDNNKITTYGLPRLTIELADYFNNEMAAKKLFDYYCKIPKFTRSDTIYYIYNRLDDFLKVLVKSPSPGLIERLKLDYSEWNKLAQKTPKKKYLSIEESQKMSIVESVKFKKSDLYVDCNYIALQIACALNYLKIKGFDDLLIERLKTKQSYPYASEYSFSKPLIIDSKPHNDSGKTIRNTTSISNFKKDYKKVEKLIFDNFENCCDAKIYQIIEKGSKARVYVSRNNGFDWYLICLKSDNTIIIDLIGHIME